MSGAINGKCIDCANSSSSSRGIARQSEIESVMLTTEAYPEGLKIAERIEVVTAECAFGMNIFKDLFTGMYDIVSGRSEAVQRISPTIQQAEISGLRFYFWIRSSKTVNSLGSKRVTFALLAKSTAPSV